MGKRLSELYPTRRYNKELYKYYVSRANKHDVERDKKALMSQGWKVRVLTLPYVAAGLGRYVIFRRRK